MSRTGTALLLAVSLSLLARCGGNGGPIRLVVVTFDTTRADRLGCYGYAEASTPNLDRFAEESVLFEHAVSSVPTTLPSHSTMFTGLYPHDHGARYNLIYRLDAKAETVAELLSRNGFATAGFPASFILDKKFGIQQGFETWVDPPQPDAGGGEPEGALRRAEQGVDQALEWLDDHQGRKAFAWLHFYDPHAPYRPPFPFSFEFRDRPYEGELAYADSHFGRFLDALRASPDWDRTVLIVAGDHGEGLHDHGERLHSYLVYESTQHVPFMVRAPGAPARRVAEPITLADVMPTLLDFAGVPLDSEVRGISLVPAVTRGERLPRRDVYFESHAGKLNYGWQELSGVRAGRWKLIDSSAPELFDLEADPREENNLAALEGERLQDLRATLKGLAVRLGGEAPVEQAQDLVMDPETEALLLSLGYAGEGGGSSAANAPTPREVVDLDGDMQVVRRAVRGQRWDQVEEYLRYILERDPSNKWGLKAMVTSLIEQARAREAQDFAAEMVQFYPEDEVSFQTLAQTYSVQGRYDEALEVLEQGRKVKPDSDALAYLWVVVHFEADTATVCERELPETREAFPESWRLLVLRARCEALDAELEAAVATLSEAVDKGFSALSTLEEIEEFKEVATLPAFRELRARLEKRNTES